MGRTIVYTLKFLGQMVVYLTILFLVLCFIADLFTLYDNAAGWSLTINLGAIIGVVFLTWVLNNFLKIEDR